MTLLQGLKDPVLSTLTYILLTFKKYVVLIYSCQINQLNEMIIGFRPKKEMLRTESVVEEGNFEEKPCCIGTATPPLSPVTVSFKTSQEGLDKIFEKPSENGEVVVNTDVSLNNVENHVDIIVNDESAVNMT